MRGLVYSVEGLPSGLLRLTPPVRCFEGLGAGWSTACCTEVGYVSQHGHTLGQCAGGEHCHIISSGHNR